MAGYKPGVFWTSLFFVESRDPRTERESKVCRDILISKKVIFRTMRTMRKQFPVNLLTSRRLAFTIQRTKTRRCQQIKKMAAKVEGRYSGTLS